MSKIITTIVILIMCLNPMTAFAAGTEVTSNDLIDKAAEYDGCEVVYAGEIIGDIMARGDYTWINVSDGSNAIGVWVKSSNLQGIDTAGRYNMRGDTVRITGIFYRACAEHGGDLDIHATKIELTENGYAITHTVDPVKVVLSILLLAGAMTCIVIMFKKRKVKKLL